MHFVQHLCIKVLKKVLPLILSDLISVSVFKESSKIWLFLTVVPMVFKAGLVLLTKSTQILWYFTIEWFIFCVICFENRLKTFFHVFTLKTLTWTDQVLARKWMTSITKVIRTILKRWCSFANISYLIAYAADSIYILYSLNLSKPLVRTFKLKFMSFIQSLCIMISAQFWFGYFRPLKPKVRKSKLTFISLIRS